eukprot:12406-Heterococcus_DN1.PRE.6
MQFGERSHRAQSNSKRPSDRCASTHLAPGFQKPLFLPHVSDAGRSKDKHIASSTSKALNLKSTPQMPAVMLAHALPSSLLALTAAAAGLTLVVGYYGQELVESSTQYLKLLEKELSIAKAGGLRRRDSKVKFADESEGNTPLEQHFIIPATTSYEDYDAVPYDNEDYDSEESEYIEEQQVVDNSFAPQHQQQLQQQQQREDGAEGVFHVFMT